MRLTCGSILICEDCVFVTRIEARRSRDIVCCKMPRPGEDGWDDGEVVLVFEEVRGRSRCSLVEGIKEIRIMRPEGKFIDQV
jgi:hypothetical protein